MNSHYNRNLMEVILDPFFAINSDGKITDLNNATLNSIALPRDKLINSDFFIHFTEPSIAKKACFEIFNKGYINNFSLKLKDFSGTQVLCNGSVYRNKENEIVGAVIIARDMTEQKKSATDLQEARIFAKQETQKAEAAKIKEESSTRIAEYAERSKQQFLSKMSREIRTPMNAIIGFTRVVLKTELSAKQTEYLEAIKTSGDSLIVFMNKILTLIPNNGKSINENIITDVETTIDLLENSSDDLSLNILVVEDIPLNQLLMKTLLDDFGFASDIVENGKIAIEKLKVHKYDLILMDLQMPVMDGFETTDSIRKKLNLGTPIIALTADVTSSDFNKCIEVGMQDYLAKPVDETKLYNKIINTVKKSRNVEITVQPQIESMNKSSYINLDYLRQRTKSNASLMMEMISIYLEQTPHLIVALNESFLSGDWDKLQSVVHKMIPSFSIMGMNNEFVTMAHQIKEFANAPDKDKNITNLVTKLTEACSLACEELQIELIKIKKNQK